MRARLATWGFCVTRSRGGSILWRRLGGAAGLALVAIGLTQGVRAARGDAAPAHGRVQFVEIAGRRALSGRLIVRPIELRTRAIVLGDRAAAEQHDARARQRLEANVLERVTATDEYIVRVPPGETEESYARALLATGDYASVEPDWRLSLARVPDDALAPLQWHHARIGAPQAWDLTIGSPSIVCAVCDTGVDLTHPDLAPVLVEGGFAAGLGPVVPQSEGGEVMDPIGHGTLVAGCLGAAGDNTIGVAGCGWDLRIMPVRVSNEPDGSAFLSDITKGARWAAERGARIINCSYEGVSSESVQATGQYIKGLGGLLFWAAGNYAQNWTTFDHEDVMVVGASTATDDKGAFSAFGPGVDLFAPGVGIYTTELGGGYVAVDGTSFSCAVAAGVGGLVWSRNESLTPDQVEQILLSSCEDLGDPGNDDFWGWGRIDAGRAVMGADPPAGPPGPFTLLSPPDQSTDVSATPRLEWSESAEAGFYRVLLDDDPAFGSPEIDEIVLFSELDVELGQLAFDTTYQWTVVAQNLLGSETLLPQVATFSTGPLPPPGEFALLSPGEGESDVSISPNLVWEPSYLADTYEVVVAEVDNPTSPLVDQVIPSAQTSLLVSDGTLLHGHTYAWSVTATNGAGEQSATPGTFATEPPPPPAAFTLLAPSNGATGVPTGPTFAWTASENAERYVVEVDEAPTFPSPLVTQIVEVPNIVAVFEPGTLAPLTVYYWRTRAQNPSGDLVAAPLVSAFTTAAPPPPRCTGDINADGLTDVYDFVDLARNFGTTSGATRREGDLNGDGAVNAVDFGSFAADFGCHE